MWDQFCPECNRLWREYAWATNEDIKLDGQRKLAVLRYDPGSEQLTMQSETAAHERESLRQQIKEHEASHNGFAPMKSAAE
ncbi:MAG: hypothetical protein DMG57_03005 [Acidobacteria bacterium]|nr:MAG: hypothetical protein DMG57_03005 [Acidobacteriota bacterium]